MSFGKIKEFKTYNLTLLKNMGRALTFLKNWNKANQSSRNSGQLTCCFVLPYCAYNFGQKICRPFHVLA